MISTYVENDRIVIVNDVETIFLLITSNCSENMGWKNDIIRTGEDCNVLINKLKVKNIKVRKIKKAWRRKGEASGIYK